MKRAILMISIYFISLFVMNAQETIQIKITVGATSFVGTLDDNATAMAFVSLLPLTVTMNELNGNEKYHDLPGKLPTSPERPTTIQEGDLMLYGQNTLVLFYETFTSSYSYTKIGHIGQPTGLKTALGPNNSTVTFELIGNATGMGSIEQDKVDFRISKEGLLSYTGNAQKISLFDMNGRQLLSTSSGVLDVNNLLGGIYILKVEGQNQVRTMKVKI